MTPGARKKTVDDGGRFRRALRRKFASTIAVVLLAVGSAHATDAPTVVRVERDATVAADGTLRWAAAVDVDALLAREVGDAAVVELPGRPSRTVVVVGIERHPSGSITWRAEAADDPGRPLTITVAAEGVAGVLADDREGSVVLSSDDDGTWVVDRAAVGLEPAEPEVDDAAGWFRVPRRAPGAPTASASAAAAQGMVLPKPAPGEIDVLLLYSTGLAKKLGAGLGARLDNLVALANRSYADSGIALRLNVLDTLEIALPDDTSDFDALYRMTDGDVPATAGLQDLRERYGADLVVLVRPYDAATHQGCGAAWISGYGGAPIEWSSDYGFATVSDGQSGSKYCDDLAFAHEIGHNLGAMHDRANAGTAVGAYPFGFGYGVRGKFGTVMSYVSPRIGRYSDPDTTCSGVPCGISETRSDSAHDELAIRLARLDVAAFRRSLHLDFPFGDLGRATAAAGSGVSEGRAVAVLADGRVVGAGFVDRDATSSVVVARWLADGSLDTSFGTGGVVERQVTGGRARGAALGVQSDGRVVVAGTVEKSSGDSAGFALRLGADGKADTTFGPNGLYLLGDAGQKRRFTSLVVSPVDDDVLLAGEADNAATGATSALVVRIDRNGSPRANFGTAGVVRHVVPGGSAHGHGIGLLADGRIVVGGTLERTDGRSDMLALRLLPDGRLDAAFGGSGQVRIDLGSGRAHAQAVAVEKDGDVVLAGRHERDGLPALMAAVRILSTGARDLDFGKSGLFTLDLVNGDAMANGVAIDAKSRIFLAGSYREADGASNFVTVGLRRGGVRLKAFAQGGVSVPTFPGESGTGWAVAIGPDGKPVVAGAKRGDVSGQAVVLRHTLG